MTVQMVFHCSACDTHCDTSRRFEKHCLTAKHLKNVQPKKTTYEYECECGNVYSHKPSLSRHRRTCTAAQAVTTHVACSNGTQQQCHGAHPQYHTTVTNNITNINNHVVNNISNPVINFNIYLNEHCRDAVCIEDFCNTLANRIGNADGTKVNISFIDNKEAFSHVLGNLMFMNSVTRPIQSFQGEIVEKSNNDWRTLTLDNLNSHVKGIASQVNWAKFSGLPQPVTNNDLLQHMVALHAATQIHPPLKDTQLEQLRKATLIGDSNTTTSRHTITKRVRN